ncbi:MAG: hypothetical protein LBO65_03990 [Spirochaetaceae bacterium]|jgi:hypothetical protein|nr:hypothetical protein [Spirochaetaceae bacterium]
MKLNIFDFHNWLSAPSHQGKDTRFDAWSREIYPWILFNEINFDKNLINQIQTISIEELEYMVTILSIAPAYANRIKAIFRVDSNMSSDKDNWKVREWHDVFEIIYTKGGDFVTVYIQDFDINDNYKKYLRKFKEGDFDPIVKNRTFPLFMLLYSALASLIIEEKYPEAKYRQRFKFNQALSSENRYIWKSNEVIPLWSMGRSIWFFASREEEKAHRLGMMLAKQCERLIIIYNKPTHTQYEKCTGENVTVISLLEFSEKYPPSNRAKYEKQMLLLINNLYAIDDRPLEELVQRISEIGNDGYPYASLHQLREAKEVNSLPIYNIFDAFYSLSCALILNTWQDYTKNRENETHDKKFVYNPKVYSFKEYLPVKIHDIVNYEIDDVTIYCAAKSEVANTSICFFSVFGYQFSFHVVPMKTLQDFLNSSKNKYQEWAGKRLKHVATLLLILSRKIYFWSKELVNLTVLTAQLKCHKERDGWIALDELLGKMNKHFLRRKEICKNDLISCLQKKPKGIEFEISKKNNQQFVRIKEYKPRGEIKKIYEFVINNI